MKKLLALLAIALLGVDVAACGGAGKGTGSASQTHTNVVATASTGSTRTSTAGGRPRAFEPGSYETVGVAASEADRRAVTAVVKRYYAAVAANDGAQACSLLNRPLAKSIAEDYGNALRPSYMRGKTCPVVMSKMFMHRNGRPTSDVSGMEVTGVRVVEDIAAVALLRSPTMPVGETSLRREGDIWTMDQMLGSSLN